jgi:uncharacterized RDD family membrane protein YckC
MICTECKNEIDGASLFCHVCDIYRPAPIAGKKANIGVRLLAHVLDAFVALAIFMMIGFVSCSAGAVGGLGAAGIQAGSPANSQDLASVAPAVTSAATGLGTFLLAFVGYIAVLFFFLARGKTPGKALCGIRVADKRNGSFPGMGRMLLRETLGKFVSGLFLLFGYFWAILDRDSQAWHDKIAGTVVLRTPSRPAIVAAEIRAGA